MRGLLIDSFARTISPISLSDDNVHLFCKEVNQALRSSSHIYTSCVDGTLQIIVDENCLLDNTNTAFFSSFISRPLFGNAILIGRDVVTGNKTDLPAECHVLSVHVEFCSPQQTEEFRQEAIEYVRGLNNM